MVEIQIALSTYLNNLSRVITTNTDGAILIDGGAAWDSDPWGRPTVAEDSVIIDRALTGALLELKSNYIDKDMLKSKCAAKWDAETKRWSVPVDRFNALIDTFLHITISPKVVAYLERILTIKAEAAAARLRPAWDNVLPHDMTKKQVTLYPYQLAGVQFLLKQQTAVLGFAVGLGKTPTAITAANVLLDRKSADRVLIIAPNSVKFQWLSEVAKFSDRTAVVLDNSTEARLRKSLEIAKNSDYVILHYEFLRNEKHKAELQQLVKNAVIVADEAHKVKNYKATQTKEFIALTALNTYVWLLTATPFPNAQPRETYTILSHTRKAEIGTWYTFSDRYVTFERGFGGRQVPVRLKNHKALRIAMQDIVIMRQHNSEDVQISLPSTRYITPELTMTDDQHKVYRAMANDLMDELTSMTVTTFRQNAANILAKLKRLEQIANDVDLLDEEHADTDKLSVKEDWAVSVIQDHLENTGNRGIVIFSESKLMLKKIRSALMRGGLSSDEVRIISGEVSPATRTQIVTAFGSGEAKVVLSTSAGEEGINLQMGGHTMIHLDQPWVPKSITQREGRILRNGQTSEYTLFYSPLMSGTVEFYKRAKIMSKVAEIEKLLGKGAAGSVAENVNKDSATWTLEDLKDMLRG